MNARDPSKIEKDYGLDGIDIQTAMVHHAKAHPVVNMRPRHILWNGQVVWTSLEIIAPEAGVFKIDFLSEPIHPAQGVDVKIEGGAIQLPNGDLVRTLRTWHEGRYEGSVEYRYRSDVGRLKVWNVYRRHWPDGRVTEEKWTGNAGFLVEEQDGGAWVLRCSSGSAKSPAFNQLILRMSVSSLSD